jgi:predicted enzyme related to lactoylglutathione lyase
MAKLRHLAMQVPDLEKAAVFYERCFDMNCQQGQCANRRRCGSLGRRYESNAA